MGQHTLILGSFKAASDLLDTKGKYSPSPVCTFVDTNIHPFTKEQYTLTGRMPSWQANCQ